MKNIAIALNAGFPAQRNAITNFFTNHGWPYWHWIDDFWIVQVPDFYTPSTLYAEIENLPEVESVTILLFEFHGTINFWGRADTAAWNWLNHIGSSN